MQVASLECAVILGSLDAGIYFIARKLGLSTLGSPGCGLRVPNFNFPTFTVSYPYLVVTPLNDSWPNSTP